MPREDCYGRTLAYIYLEGGRLLNLEIVDGDYGHACTRLPFAKREEFRAAERYARETGRQLWGETHHTSILEPIKEGTGRSRRAEEPRVRPGFEGSSSSWIPASQCCKVCRKGQACGNSCIGGSYTCRNRRGCACDAVEVCR